VAQPMHRSGQQRGVRFPHSPMLTSSGTWRLPMRSKWISAHSTAGTGRCQEAQEAAHA
jgi:hypothetical protein